MEAQDETRLLKCIRLDDPVCRFFLEIDHLLGIRLIRDVKKLQPLNTRFQATE